MPRNEKRSPPSAAETQAIAERKERIEELKRRIVTELQSGSASLDTLLVSLAPPELGEGISELLTGKEVEKDSPARPYYNDFILAFGELAVKEISVEQRDGTNYIHLRESSNT